MYGKDALPKDTIKKITRIFKRAGMSIEIVSWKHPVPHVWSVHVRETHCHALYVNGKGTTKTEALASALGEFIERVMTGYSFTDFALIGIQKQKKFLFSPDEKWFGSGKTGFPQGLLTTKLRALYDPAGQLNAEDLVDRMSAGYGKNAICTRPFKRVKDNKTIYFPINVLDNLYASNGMAAGNTKEEASVQALSEVFERYVKTTIIRQCIAIPDIPKDFYASLEPVVRAINALKEAGFRVLVKDASLGGRFPVVNVTIIDKKARKCFLAFGAHPSFPIALTRTVTELLQGQKLRTFRGLKKPSRSKKEVREASNLVAHFIDSSGIVSEDFFKKKPKYRLRPVNFAGTRTEEEQFLLSIFKKFKKEVYVNDISIDGFSICRVVVPGWSEVYPVDNLVHTNDNRARSLAQYVFKLPKATPSQMEEVLSLIDDGSLGDQEIVATVLGIALDEGSPWERLCFGELKLLILLYLGKRRLARVQLAWCFDVGCVREEMKDVYECMAGFFDEKENDWFSNRVVSRALRLFAGADVFYELYTPSGMMRGTMAHQKIIKAFIKSRKLY